MLSKQFIFIFIFIGANKILPYIWSTVNYISMKLLNATLLFILLFGCKNSILIAKQVDTITVSNIDLKVSAAFNKNNAIHNSTTLNNMMGEMKKGGVFLLPGGTIWLNESLIIPSNTHLLGDSNRTMLAISPDFLIKEEGFILNKNYHLGTAEFDENIRLERINILGNNVSNAKGKSRGIFFNKVNNVVIHDVNIYDTEGEGIRINNSFYPKIMQDIVISSCEIIRRGATIQNILVSSFIEDGRNAKNISSAITTVKIIDNLSIGGHHGILIMNVQNVIIERNKCIGNTQRGIIISPTNNNISIKDNRVDSAGSTGIHVAFRSTNVSIINNHVSNTVKDMSGKGFEGQGIKAYTGFTNLVIKANLVEQCATDGIALEGGGAGEKFTISDNVIKSNARNGIRLWAGDLDIEKGGNINNGIVENNKIEGNREDGIFIGSDNLGKNRVRNVTIANNNTIKAINGKKLIKTEFADNTIIIKR